MKQLYIDRIEYDVVGHCNLRCYGCTHSSPFYNKYFVDVERFENDLRIIQKTVKTKYLKLLGGEPLMHGKILELINIAKSIGLSSGLIVTTNGLLLSRQPDEFWKAVDRVDLSYYPAMRHKIDLPKLKEKAARGGATLNVIDMGSFREPVVDYPIEDDNLIKDIFKTCVQAKFCITISNGYIYKCATSPFIDAYLQQLDYNTSFKTTDGIPIENDGDMHGKIVDYLTSPEALGACRFCLGSVGKKFSHRLMTRDEVRSPVRKNKAEELIDRDMLKVLLRAETIFEKAAVALPGKLTYMMRKAFLIWLQRGS